MTQGPSAPTSGSKQMTDPAIPETTADTTIRVDKPVRRERDHRLGPQTVAQRVIDNGVDAHLVRNGPPCVKEICHLRSDSASLHPSLEH